MNILLFLFTIWYAQARINLTLDYSIGYYTTQGLLFAFADFNEN
jgi:hypothetical protein